MDFKRIFDQLNIFAQCKKYHVSLWQCPQFLFLLMGLVIISFSLLAFFVGNRYIQDPRLVALIILFLAGVLFIIADIIIHSFERLAQASRMKSEFVSVVSHQLKSPISNLKWALELLMSGRTARILPEQTDYFKILKENIARMRVLVSDLLTVSKIETSSFSLNKKQVSLEKIVKQLILDFGHFAEASNVKIEFLADKGLPDVLADPFQIRQVMENLLDNAIRYVKDNGRVKILLAKKGKNIYFEIKDNGVGIPKADQKYIFQKFFRSENVLRRQTQGSGLGLFIARAIVQSSGGRLGFKSQEGLGSVFWFRLPIK